ncbi:MULTISPECIES: hypothetical protein [Methanoculleus]|uniref:Uncharacterized protein n=2 Tax=Methanoculleus TaxID=45989 RepID=A3CTA4_METMJ|nr:MULTISPECIES: hypothetical protein [Methanoculleus]ABN56604.1 hypothetical protein Memar_0671 [Methanoculleus marisnigri JR1]MCC7555702.1 hypothetical protein [Methanoculleus marisnigri]UYU18043.1 hypothetical protein OH143_10085 [Methanoculleus submarinus]
MITRLRQKASDSSWPRPPAADLPVVLLVGVVAGLLLVQGAVASAAPIVVAASDSSATAKAHYACDGLDDRVEIQAALAALPDGGTVVLSDAARPVAVEWPLSEGADLTRLEVLKPGGTK